MRVVVIGGGLAGLFTASELVAGGVEDVVVVEADATPGGVARTIERDGFSLEPAAGSFTLPHPHLSPILEREGVTVTPAQSSSTRYVVADGGLHEIRPSPGLLMSPILPWRAKLRALAEPLVRSSSPPEETLAAFCRRRFGLAAGEMLASLMATGVFAGDPEDLGVEAAFPMLVGLEREHGSLLVGAMRRRRSRDPDSARPTAHVPVDGMAAISDAIASSLGERMRLGFHVQAVRRNGTTWEVVGPEAIAADVVVVAVPPRQATSMDTPVSDHLQQPVAAHVAVVGLGGRRPSPLPEGFGALVAGQGILTRGALFESSYAPSRAPDDGWLVKVIVGGAAHEGVVDRGDDELARAVLDELSAILGADLDADFVEIARHRPGIPQYGREHTTWLHGLEELSPPGLHFTGWGYRGVGISHIATDAARVADLLRRPGA